MIIFSYRAESTNYLQFFLATTVSNTLPVDPSYEYTSDHRIPDFYGFSLFYKVIIITKVSTHFFIFDWLRRIITILFLSVYLFSFTELHQLLKIPVLVEHFHEHRQEDKTISFWAFIKMHYLGKIVVDKDYDRDQQLPLRDADCGMMAINSLYECQHTAVEVTMPSEMPRKFTSYYQVSKPRFTAYDIFQPPRTA